MKQLIVKSCWLAFISTSLFLTACNSGGGGGGSGTGGFEIPNINETPLAITADNQNAVASTTTDGISGTTDSGGIALGVKSESNISSPSVFDFSSNKLINYVKQGAGNNANLVSGVTQVVNEPCDSGEISITIDITDPGSETLVAGDSASLTAKNCKSNIDGTTVNGTFSLTVVSGSIDFNCLSSCPDVTVSVNFNNFRVTEGGTTATIHGSFTMSQSETGGTASFSGTSLYLVSGSEAVHLTDFDISSTTVGVTTSTTANFTIAGTVIDGSITVETTDPVLQDVGESHPHGGTIVVTGAGGATLTIVYVDSTQVDLTLDPDGPGGVGPNPTVRVAWADM